MQWIPGREVQRQRMFRRLSGEFTLWHVQEPRRLHKAVIQSTGGLSLTQTLSKTFLNWSFGGRCDTASNICLFPREQQHSGLIIKQHRSSEFEKVPWFLFWVKDLLFYGFPPFPNNQRVKLFYFLFIKLWFNALSVLWGEIQNIKEQVLRNLYCPAASAKFSTKHIHGSSQFVDLEYFISDL